MASSPRRITALAIGTLAALSLAACSGGSSSNPGPKQSGGVVQITLSHGYTDVEAKAITAQVATWNASHPKIHVKLVFNGGNDGALQKTLAGLAAGSSPDIAYEYGSSMAALAGRPQVVDLSDKVKDPSFNWNDFYSFERDAAMSSGKVYGVPALVDNLGLVYNKKLFDAAGLAYPTESWTWDDFRAAAKKLTDAGRKQYGWAYVADGSEDTTWRWLAMFWQAGGDLVSSDGTKAAFDSPAGLKATQLLHDMAVTDKSVYLDQGNGNYLNLFNSGKIGMLWTGPWDLSSINSDVSYGVQILPAANGTHSSIAGPDNWLVFNNGAARERAAWTFLTWLTSAQTHGEFTLGTGDLPARTSETKLASYPAYLAKYPGDAVFVLNLGNVTKARPNTKTYPQVSQAIGSQLQGVFIGRTSPQDALTAAARQADSALASGQ
jgi:multiple sugar transport system substrate-binding protein